MAGYGFASNSPAGTTTPEMIVTTWLSAVQMRYVDDHLRNHGFLHVDRGQWRLAPAFDVNPFPDRVRELKTWVSEDAGPEATIDALMSALPYFRIAVPRAREILRDVEHAVSQWRRVGRSLGMTKRELDQFAEAFEHEERSAARHHLT
jgi:serine/threonine-protein kinase HipA